MKIVFLLSLCIFASYASYASYASHLSAQTQALHDNEHKLDRSIKDEIPHLPGADNWGRTKDIVNYVMGSQLFDIYFDDTCKTSDGRYLIACGLYMDTIYKTDTDLSSEVDTTTADYTSDENTAVSGSVGGGFLGFKAKGSYSQSHEHVNAVSSSESKTYITTKIRMQLYRIYTNTATMKLSKEFKQYITNMVSALNSSNSQDYQYWMYQFTKQFPSTYVSEIVVGGALVQNLFVDDSFCSTTDKDILSRSASASASFAGFGASGMYNYGLTQQQIDTFRKHTSHVTTTSIGGIYYLNNSITDWQHTVIDEPAVLEYTLADTVNFIVPQILPEYPEHLILKIRNDYQTQQKDYLESNTHLGCTYRNATNYKVWANAENDQCVFGNRTGSSFGGFYITNHMLNGQAARYMVPNYLTGDYTCMTNGSSSSVASCSTRNYPIISITVCVCLADSPSDNRGPGLAGGYGTAVNQITGGNSCPPSFTPITTPMGGAICQATNPVTNGYFMGGVFVTDYNTGECLTPNKFASGCTCPTWAPLMVGLNTMVQEYDWFFQQITLCYGGSQFQPPTDPGKPIPYQGIAVPIYELSETSSTITISTMSTTESTKAPQDFWTSNIPLFIGLGVLSIGVLLISVYVIRLHRRRDYMSIA